MRGYQHDGVVSAIREAGGQIYAVTSEPQSLARNAQDDWEAGYEHVGDPHQEILAQCVEKGWLSLFIGDHSEDFIGRHGDGSSNDLRTWVSHPKGYFQPGVLALSQSKRVLYRWSSRPTRSNAGGAARRPTAPHVWESIQAALAEPVDAPDVPHDDNPVFDTKPIPWPLFVGLLIANGWFLRAQPFDQRVTGPTMEMRLRTALIRLLGFVAAWVAAFTLLPTWLAALGLAGWAVKITPAVRLIHNTFQNVGPNETPASVQALNPPG